MKVKSLHVAVALLGVLMASQVFAVRPASPLDERRALINPAKPGELTLRATYAAVSVCFGAEQSIAGLRFQYRAQGTSAWKSALEPPYFFDTHDYRGSIVNLDEDTMWEVRVCAGERVLAEGSVRTWKTKVPVARTIEVDPATAWPYIISEKGTPDGWIRYVAKDGAKLVRDALGPLFVITNAAYVILEDMVIEGGAGAAGTGYPIAVRQSQGVRLLNLEISKWGRTGPVDYTRKGRCVANGREINMDAAIHVGRGCSEVTIERCYIHDPLINSCSWFYSHPAGNEAVIMGFTDHSTVIRWCDFVGSDEKRYNDCIEGEGNFFENGGFNRDADIYGNFLIYANDDCIELDGGQQNVRVWGNWFEGALCGVSVQGNCASPTYLFNNVFAGMNDQMRSPGQQIKTSSVDPWHYGPYILVANNSFWGAGTFNVKGPAVRFDLRNNLFGGVTSLTGIDADRSPKCCFVANTGVANEGTRTGVDATEEIPYANAAGGRYELTTDVPGVTVANFMEGSVRRGAAVTEGLVNLPHRPLPFALDRGRITANVTKGVAEPAAVSFKAKWIGVATDARVSFKVRQNDVFDWFTVTPAQGTIGPGEEVAFTVTFDPARMANRRYYRGAFQIRTPEGLSRVCSIEAKTDFVPPYRAERPGEKAFYFDAFTPVAGTPKIVSDVRGKDGRVVVAGKELEYAFDIPEDGRYYILVHGAHADGPRTPISRVPTCRLNASVDGAPKQISIQQVQEYMTWTMITPGKKQGEMIAWWNWKAGRHTLRISQQRAPFIFDGFVVTTNPGGFEPR